MSTEFILPELGENITAGDVVKVLVKVGDTIAENQPLLELETDKAVIEVPSTLTGLVKAVHVKPGEKAKVGSSVLTVETNGAAVKKAEAPKAAETKVEVKAETPPMVAEKPVMPPAPPVSEVVEKLAPVLVTADSRAMVPASPSVRRLAREIGVEIREVKGTGPVGRISEADVKNHSRKMHSEPRAGGGMKQEPLPNFAQWGAVERQAMSNVRAKTATHLSYAWATIPHVTQFDKADITELEQLRKNYAPRVEKAGGKLTMTAILLKMLASAMKKYPQFNASVDMNAQEIIFKKYINIGVAVDTDRGLIVPVIRNCDKKNVFELAMELSLLSEKARSRKTTIEEMQGGCITITNLGGIGGHGFTPIVNSPEVAILAVSKASTEPVFRNGEFKPRLILPLALSYDHRLIDGADAARFLRWICEAVEQPFLMSFEG